MATTTTTAQRPSQSTTLVILGASLGTMFEWYDFFLYGALAGNIAAHFFSAADETTAFIFALAAFAAGFLVRPFGAVIFGRVGDVVGRKNTFLATMAIMGLATFLVGLLPTYDQVGMTAPLLLVGLRILQGLAIGGEYGGAAIYVAEHAPPNRRGFQTSFINATATLGLLLSLFVIMGTRAALSADDFADWGWRIPFLVSVVLLAISIWIRMRLEESPVFRRMKEEAATSKAPLAEAFGSWANIKPVLLALFVGMSGSTTIWYTAHFYSLFFLQRVLKVDGFTTNLMLAAALVIGGPTYVFFGWLSDKIGRRLVILGGYALAIVLTFTLFHQLTEAANPALAEAQATAPVIVSADQSACSFQFDPLGRTSFDRRSCDIAKSYLTHAGINYANAALDRGAGAEVHIGDKTVPVPDPRLVPPEQLKAQIAKFGEDMGAALEAAGYPREAAPASIDVPYVIAIVAFLIILSAMTYAPLAAMMVELFPARIRYTSMSVPYHIGAGWIGGFLPTTAFAIVAATGDIYSGLWYPVIATAVSLVVGIFALPETFERPIGH
ncbi:MAG: MFS transporter [Alphaproteobacteria bacterium]|nr:MFS transporter [Alphaproteobacteria bacterium]